MYPLNSEDQVCSRGFCAEKGIHERMDQRMPAKDQGCSMEGAETMSMFQAHLINFLKYSY